MVYTGPKNSHGDPMDRPMPAPSGPCITRIANSAALGTFAGTFYGAAIMAWNPDEVAVTRHSHPRLLPGAPTSSSSMIRLLGPPAIWMAGTCATFSAVECLSESLREKRDSWNAVYGGMAAGAVIGSTTKRIDFMVVTALGTGLFLGMLDWYGPNSERDPEQIRHKVYDTLPAQHVESEAMKSLKEKYPKFKDL